MKIDLAHQLEAHATAHVHHARIRGQREHPRGTRGAAHRYPALEQLTSYARPAPLARDRLAPRMHDRLLDWR